MGPKPDTRKLEKSMFDAWKERMRRWQNHVTDLDLVKTSRRKKHTGDRFRPFKGIVVSSGTHSSQ